MLTPERNIAAVRRQHVNQDYGCTADGFAWPCDTAVALAALAESQARVSALTAARERDRRRFEQWLAMARASHNGLADLMREIERVLAAADRQPDGEG